MDRQFITSIIRHLLTKASGIALAHGYISSNDTEMFLSTGLFLSGLVWSYVEKRYQASKPPLAQ
jgi:hypothetical protein